MIDELMELAMQEMQNRLPKDCCTDDWQWNDTCFQFVIIYADGRVSAPYRFCYDTDEELCGTGVEQLMDWLNYRF